MTDKSITSDKPHEPIQPIQPIVDKSVDKPVDKPHASQDLPKPILKKKELDPEKIERDKAAKQLAFDKQIAADKEARTTQKADLLDQMNLILAEAGGESNVGLTNPYWDYLRQYRTLEAMDS